jgi:hypothetical protein
MRIEQNRETSKKTTKGERIIGMPSIFYYTEIRRKIYVWGKKDRL